ncbi:hypothetical protein Mgra_00007306 [Meloidogyne graminicola]|uniref:Rhodanese domain-containing protein n=1 Tax=Meloidogyne graminicola TaxID=189291 RepID=A0A8S9ZJ56_9BILA|nr:hypothetical protein Mgra_00007306 [Meloidogyne graminicola]
MPVVTENPKLEEEASREEQKEKKMKRKNKEEEKPKEEGEEVKEEDKNVEETTTTTIKSSTNKKKKKKEEENQNTNNINEEEIIKLMSEALKRSNFLIQNVTLILPGDANPTLIQTFLQTLLASNRPLNEQPNINLENTIQPVPLFPSNQFYPPANIPPQAVYPTITTIHQQHPTRPTYLIQVEQLNDWITSGKNIKILDASYDPEPLPINHVKFYSEYYAKWDKLLAEKRNIQYERSHIEGAISFNLNIATYPSWNERQALYSPELFQQYIQRLGIDQNDQLVIYGRGPIGGMLQSARVWFLFRIYGHENVGIIDGGLEALKNSGLIEITNGTTETSLGNWTAKFHDDLLSTFEELTTADIYGYCILSRINWYNFLDARPRNEFFGLSGIYDNQRGHLTGSKSFPADELVNPKGFLLSKEEILAKLTQIGYNRNYQTIIFGNTADEASIILLALAIVQDTKAKLYNGGMEEIRRRAPYLINLK